MFRFCLLRRFFTVSQKIIFIKMNNLVCSKCENGMERLLLNTVIFSFQNKILINAAEGDENTATEKERRCKKSFRKMFPSSALFLATFSLFFAALVNFGSTECSDSPITEQSFSLSLQSKKFEREKWINSFSLNGYLSNESDALLLDLKHEIVKCGGERKFHILGTLKETPFKNSSDDLAFHPKCGVNVALFNNGHSLKKLNVEDRINGVVFTNRPLKINEVFEVKIDNKINKLGYFMGIGVTTNSPNEIGTIPGHFNGVKTGTWMLYHNHVFNNGNLLIKENDQHLDKLQVGDRVGIMISEFGSLHLFINGADKGPVASGIPSPMYGIFEFYGDLAQVTLTSRT